MLLKSKTNFVKIGLTLFAFTISLNAFAIEIADNHNFSDRPFKHLISCQSNIESKKLSILKVIESFNDNLKTRGSTGNHQIDFMIKSRDSNQQLHAHRIISMNYRKLSQELDLSGSCENAHRVLDTLLNSNMVVD